jgi:metal-responsive CopG/Arc/MetJ family transcriptional regulator
MMYMKAIQVSFDETLLEKLDADEEVIKDGRSAVLRRAAAAYLKRKRSARIAEAYRRGYGESGGLGSEFEGWENQGTWPEK